jgi:hypothetical protein
VVIIQHQCYPQAISEHHKQARRKTIRFLDVLKPPGIPTSPQEKERRTHDTDATHQLLFPENTAIVENEEASDELEAGIYIIWFDQSTYTNKGYKKRSYVNKRNGV